MSYPYSDPQRTEGLLAHTERYLGPVAHGEGPEAIGGGNRGFAIGFHKHPDGQMISAASTGVRFQNITALLPEEFVVSALPGQENEASYLVHVIGERVVRSGKGYEYGGGYVNSEPLIPGTNIVFLLAWSHPFLEEEFDVYYDDQGNPALRYITLIPATGNEFHLVRDHDDNVETLMDLWKSRGTNLLDIYRDSAI